MKKQDSERDKSKRDQLIVYLRIKKDDQEIENKEGKKKINKEENHRGNMESGPTRFGT